VATISEDGEFNDNPEWSVNDVTLLESDATAVSRTGVDRKRLRVHKDSFTSGYGIWIAKYIENEDNICCIKIHFTVLLITHNILDYGLLNDYYFYCTMCRVQDQVLSTMLTPEHRFHRSCVIGISIGSVY
jgi:hypothetical protein